MRELRFERAGRLAWHEGSSGGVLSVLSLLDSGVFTEEKAEAIRAAMAV